MGKYPGVNRYSAKITVLVFSIVLVSLLHFLIPIEPHTLHKVHIILRKLYFLPPVMAAAWFGLRGALFTTLAISVLFTSHAIFDWPGNYMEQANQMGELAFDPCVLFQKSFWTSPFCMFSERCRRLPHL